MLQSMPAMLFNWRMDPDYSSDLIVMFKKEYVSDKPHTLVCLSTDENGCSYPRILLRKNGRLDRKKCLADVKDRILSIIQGDDSILNVRDHLGLSPIHLICSLHSPGQMKILKILCTQRKSLVNVLDSQSNTPLHHALSPNNLKYHAECDNSGESLIDIVKLLVDNGANVNALNCHAIAPLHLALDFYKSGYSSLLREMPELVKTLLQGGVDLNLTAPTSLTSLHLAARLSGPHSLTIMSLLVSTDNVNSSDELCRTPLHEVILSVGNKKPSFHSRDNYDLPVNDLTPYKAKFLLDQGANVNSKDVDGKSPLLLAVESLLGACLPLIEFLLDDGASVTTADVVGSTTPMHEACKYYDRHLPTLVSLFLRTGASLNMKNTSLHTPFHYALNRPCCSLGTIATLVKFGADVSLMDDMNNNAIHMICVSPFPHFRDVLLFLLNKGCDINHVNKRGSTPLLRFLQQEYDKESIQILIDMGANCRVQDNEGVSPLHLVSRSLVYHKDVDEIVDIILKGGANVNALDCQNNTPLHYTVRDDSTTNIKAIRKLLLAGADPNMRNNLGINPLHIVCSSGSDHLAKMFLDFGADVNLPDSEGNTPLHIAQAAGENAKGIVRVLIEHGANLGAENCHNETPFTLMTLNTHHFMLGYTVILIASGKYQLTAKETTMLNNKGMFSKRYNDCFSCVKSMQTDFISDSSVTLLDFLLSKNERASRYVRNPAILLGLHYLVESPKYRWYSTMIKDKLTDALFLKTLFDRTTRSLEALFSPVRFPECVIDKILSFWDEDDMNAINRAVNTRSLI